MSTTRPFSTVTSRVQESGQSRGHAVRTVERPHRPSSAARGMAHYRTMSIASVSFRLVTSHSPVLLLWFCKRWDWELQVGKEQARRYTLRYLRASVVSRYRVGSISVPRPPDPMSMPVAPGD